MANTTISPAMLEALKRIQEEKARKSTASSRNNDMIRSDGTEKGKGFLGEIKRPDGKVSTELSITSADVIPGKEVLIPTMVPSLTKEEISHLMSGKYNPQARKGIDDVISRKAIDFARQRAAKKQPFFATPEEEGKFTPISPPVKAMQSDATQVARPPMDKIIGGKMLPDVEIIAPKKAVEYDKINYLNPFDSKYAVTKALKKINTLAGGNIEKGGYNRETASDLISRLEQTPSTIQNSIKNAQPIPNAPNLPFGVSAPVNFAVNAFNNVISPRTNQTAAALGDVILDPVNVAPAGRLAKKGLQGAASLIPTTFPKVAQRLRVLAGAAPWIDRGGNVVEGVESYNDYTKKPVPKDLTGEQKELLSKLIKYKFNKP
jgi:hypothetical protein